MPVAVRLVRSAVLILLFSSGALWALSNTAIPDANAQSVGSWDPTSGYPGSPGGVGSISCSEYAGYIYCIGGGGHNSFYAPLSFSGIGAWKDLPQYPAIPGNGGVLGASCVTASGYIYCVGGDTQGSGSGEVNATYYASISSSGAGAWNATTPYPHPIGDASCVASGGYIYCVGGFSAEVYYAPLSKSGIGPWTSTTSYPTIIGLQSCQAAGGYIYCIAGASGGDPQSGEPNGVAAVYYAPLLSSGVGAWTNTTAYPLAVNSLSCAVSGESYIYCVGGAESSGARVTAVYYAPISASGVGAWTGSTPYPQTAGLGPACVVLGNYLFCAGDDSGYHSYYAPISNEAGTSTLVVLSQDANGTWIRGFYTVLNVSKTIIESGSTPYNFTLNDGQAYTVQVDDYGPCAFSHWADTGSTNASRPVSIAGDTQVTAVYDCNDKVASWKATTPLPPDAAQAGSTSCGIDSNYIYCVSGYLSYYARASSSGIGNWSSTTPYPRNPEVGPTGVTFSQTCLTSTGYIYCVGGQGEGSGAQPSDAVVYAPVSSSGIGEWLGTTHYPAKGTGQSCVASGAYIYCLGSSGTYYAPILPHGGIGAWSQTTTYPGSLHACVASGGYIYCVGGNATDYASISPSGVGTWTATTSLPVQLYGSACAVSPESVLICVGGYSSQTVNQDFVYYAQVSSSGIGSWTDTTSYPLGSPNPNYPVGCMVPADYVYCVGYQPSSYFSAISGPMSTIVVTSQSMSGETLTGLTVVLNQSGNFIVGANTTPARFNLTDGERYTVDVRGNDACRFDHWYDTGNTTEIRQLSIVKDSAITAVFACAASTTNTSSSSSSFSSSSSESSQSTNTTPSSSTASSTESAVTTSTSSLVMPSTSTATDSLSASSSSLSSASSSQPPSTASSLSGFYALLVGVSSLVLLLTIGFSTSRRKGLATRTQKRR